MSSHFPGLEIKYWTTHNDEHYFRDNGVLKMVVSQGIPVRLELEMPGGYSKPEVCFPAPFHVRVYDGEPYPDNQIAVHRDKYTAYDEPPNLLEYRFGLSEAPWMFDGYLPREMRRKERDAVANYVIQNGSCCHSGVVIQVSRRMVRSEESLRIFSFETGNDFRFPEVWRSHVDTELLAEFVAIESGRFLRWIPIKLARR